MQPSLVEQIDCGFSKPQNANFFAHIGAIEAHYHQGTSLLSNLEHCIARETPTAHAAKHLLDTHAKQLRSICLLLAARVGRNNLDQASAKLAVAVELVHNATLLHDDVIDLGETRRNKTTARLLYGNAASIYAGDLLIVEAFRLVQAAAIPSIFDALLNTLREMVLGESLQFSKQGDHLMDQASYFKIIEGKTAALFRWAFFAGSTAAGHRADETKALESFGYHAGLAFQIVDDVLDFGVESSTGKNLLADLSQGKYTYPLLLGLERSERIRAIMSDRSNDVTASRLEESGREIVELLIEKHCLVDALELATKHAHQAAAQLECFPEDSAICTLRTVATHITTRKT